MVRDAGHVLFITPDPRKRRAVQCCGHAQASGDRKTVEDLVVLESVMCPRCGREWRTATCSSGFEADYREAARAMSEGVAG